MEKFLKRKAPSSSDGNGGVRRESSNGNTTTNIPRTTTSYSMPKLINLVDLPWDPAERKGILEYHPNQRDEIRRAYWLKGPCQPRGHDFPKKMIGNKERRFIEKWFDQYANWLEYSVKVDKAFCLCCYLCRDYVGHQGGRDAFVMEGFNSWNKTERFSRHVGDVNSFHNKALKKCEDLVTQNQSIAVSLHKQDDIVKKENRIRLNATIDACRFLLKGVLPFRGHDETETSFYKGHFLELMDYTISQNEEVRKVSLKNAPGNNQLVAPCIQKDIARCFEEEIIDSIFKDIGDDVFALLVDESSDISKKEQMAIVFRYVDRLGLVKERFVGLVHVLETSSSSLKSSIDAFFANHKLSMNRLRGQGYDGASNMRVEFNGLKAKILDENKSAYYIHCFAHQLQLVVVAVARKHLGVVNFFDMLAVMMNVVCASCKRKDILREVETNRVINLIGNGELKTGSGLNQELSLTRAGDTRWSSHYKTILRLVDLFPSVITVLEYVAKEATNSSCQNQAIGLLKYFESFDFVFYLHLMLHILGLTDILSRAFQRKDQDILEAVELIRSTKEKLQEFRQNGFDALLEKVFTFCGKHNIEMLKMEDDYVNSRGRRQRGISNRHFYEYDSFNTVVDMQIQEFGDRFSEVSTELLENMAALNPCNSFARFDASKLRRLSEFYPNDFDNVEKMTLEHELDLYHHSVKKDERFANLNGIADLSRVLVETRKHLSYPLVYRLLKRALILPVATATVERCFSTMKLVKTYLRNKMGDDFLNSCVLCAIEKEALVNVTNEAVIKRFQKMKERKGQL